MTKETFSNWSKTHAKMSRKGVLTVKQRVITFYRSLYDTTFGKNRFLVFMSSLTTPPVTVAKVFTYLLATVVLSTGVYAGIAPSSFARTSAAIKENVQMVVKTSLDAFIPDASRLVQGPAVPEDDADDNSDDQGADIREDDDEVFCDGERRDAEDCTERADNEDNEDDDADDADDNKKSIVNTLGVKIDGELDVREDDDEVFCDGERRDAEDCAERERNEDGGDDKENVVNNFGLQADVELDIRENDDEVFCDGERRDAKDCAERLAKDGDENTVDKKEEKNERNDGLVDVSRVINGL